jgi:hypothetical protein
MDWYRVRFDARGLTRAAAPPGRPAWEDAVAWADIMRVCLEMEGAFGSDSLYLFTRQRPESYAIPLAAAGAQDLLGELIRRGLFDAELAIQAATAEGLFCWESASTDGYLRDHA